MFDSSASDAWLSPHAVLPFESGKIISHGVQNGMVEGQGFRWALAHDCRNFPGKVKNGIQPYLRQCRQHHGPGLMRTYYFFAPSPQELENDVHAINAVAGNRG